METSYPRPRLVREHWLDLCGIWQFGYDDADVGLVEQWFTRTELPLEITVPFPPESTASGIGDTAFHRVVWYLREFDVPETAQPDQSWLLHFGAVDYRARVWLDGGFVGEHEGGHTPFTIDLGSNLASSKHVLVVRAEDDPLDMSQPRGKQYWRKEPGEIWYNRTTGIWQPVWLEPVAPIHIEDIRFSTDLVVGRISMTVRLNRSPIDPLQMAVRMEMGDRLFADDVIRIDSRETVREFGFDVPNVTIERNALFWSPEFPNLVDVSLHLRDQAGTGIDAITSYFGIRSVATGDGRFYLNGRPYYLRMALAQGFWPDSHLAAPSGDAMYEEVRLARELGFNGLRLHQKVEDPRYLAFCDRIGVLVWGEMPATYAFSADAMERTQREWMDAVRRDVSHPCVVAWVPFNESWGVPNLEFSAQQRNFIDGLAQLTRAYDPTRPVLGNDGWELFASDIWGVHDYALEPDVILERYGTEDAVQRSLRTVRPYYQALTFPGDQWNGQPVMFTEVGGIDYVEGGEDLPPHPRKAESVPEFLERFGALMQAILSCESIQGYVYTQLTDTAQEKSGLLTEQRTPKFDTAAIRAILTGAAKTIPSETTFGIIEG